MQPNLSDFIETRLMTDGISTRRKIGNSFSEKIIEIEKGSLPGTISVIQSSFSTFVHTSYCKNKIEKESLLSIIKTFSEEIIERHHLFIFQYEEEGTVYIQREKTPIYDIAKALHIQSSGRTKTDPLMLKRNNSPFVFYLRIEENTVSIRRWFESELNSKQSYLDTYTISNVQGVIDFEDYVEEIEQRILSLPGFINEKTKKYMDSSPYKHMYSYQEISMKHLFRCNYEDLQFRIYNTKFHTSDIIRFKSSETLEEIFEKVKNVYQGQDLLFFCLEYMKEKGLPYQCLQKRDFAIKDVTLTLHPILTKDKNGTLLFNLYINNPTNLPLQTLSITGSLEELYEQIPRLVYRKIRSCLLQSVFEENK